TGASRHPPRQAGGAPAARPAPGASVRAILNCVLSACTAPPQQWSPRDQKLHVLASALHVALVEETTHGMLVTDLLQRGFMSVTDPRHEGRAAWVKRAARGPIVGVWHEPSNRGQTLA